MRTRITLIFAILVAGWLWMDARAQSGAPLVSGAHKFERIAEGIYYATASGTMQVGANSPVIVAGEETVVIDSGTSPAAGRALIEDVKAVSTKPVKYVIDSKAERSVLLLGLLDLLERELHLAEGRRARQRRDGRGRSERQAEDRRGEGECGQKSHAGGLRTG